MCVCVCAHLSNWLISSVFLFIHNTQSKKIMRCKFLFIAGALLLLLLLLLLPLCIVIVVVIANCEPSDFDYINFT